MSGFLDNHLFGDPHKSRSTAIFRITEHEGLLSDASRVLVTTEKLMGEGFAHPPLDTLVLAMPISWKGTLQQYAGRYTENTLSKPMFESSTLSTPGTRLYCACRTNANADIRQWDIG
jgi:superfamily II DNA or RNA helicase